MLQVLRVVAIALTTIVVGSAGYAFAATDTGLAGPGGDGAGPISGFSVTNVSYTLNASDPTLIDAVRFDLDGRDTPATVKARFSSTGRWHMCTVSMGGQLAKAICTLEPPVAVAAVTDLHVVATG